MVVALRAPFAHASATRSCPEISVVAGRWSGGTTARMAGRIGASWGTDTGAVRLGLGKPFSRTAPRCSWKGRTLRRPGRYDRHCGSAG